MSGIDDRVDERVRRLVSSLPTSAPPELSTAGSSEGPRIRRMAGALASTVVVVAVIGIGLVVSGRLPVGSGITATDGAFHGAGIRFAYPREWKAHPAPAVGSFGSVVAVLGTADLAGCEGPRGVDINCAYARPLEPGTLRLVVGTGSGPNFSLFDLKPVTGWALFVDGLPAVVQEFGPNSADLSDASLKWQIAMPGSISSVYTLDASLRGPGVDEMRAQLAALIASIRFDEHPVPLPGGQPVVDAVTRALDEIDRSEREYGSDFYGCFPREPGTSSSGVVTGGPGTGSVLPDQLVLTCSTTVVATEVEIWEVTLLAAWTSGSGYAAGTYETRIYLTADGEQVGRRDGELPRNSPLSMTFQTAAPVDGPVRLEVSQPARVLDPGASVYLAPDRAGDSLSGMAVGARLFVVAGPQTIGDADWYLVQWPPSRSFVPVLGWLPSKVDGRPQAETVEPHCPEAPGLPEVVAMSWGERLLCFGSASITLSRVVVGDDPPPWEIEGEPAWLAHESSIRLYDDGGPEGVGGSMPIHLDPATGVTLPKGVLLDVTGHFDDPAASGCSRTFADDHGAGLVPEDSTVQILRCRENFVVTGFRWVP